MSQLISNRRGAPRWSGYPPILGDESHPTTLLRFISFTSKGEILDGIAAVVNDDVVSFASSGLVIDDGNAHTETG